MWILSDDSSGPRCQSAVRDVRPTRRGVPPAPARAVRAGRARPSLSKLSE
jgi:hypothetical protein